MTDKKPRVLNRYKRQHNKRPITKILAYRLKKILPILLITLLALISIIVIIQYL